MSENDNQPPAPSKQTSSVPLKKETVRVTLKAADAPPAPPTVGPPTAPAVRPPTPSAPPAPSAPTAGGPPRAPAPAPTIPLRSAGTVPAPAPTIKLATSTAPIRPGGGGGAAPGLPKATVPLSAPTQPLTARPPVPVSTLRMDDEEEEVETGTGLTATLSVIGFIAAAVVLIGQIMIANAWTEGQLGRLFE